MRHVGESMNLAEIIDGHPDGAPALLSRGKVTTYGDLRRQVADLRGGLHGLGVRPGDRVALASPSNWFFAVSYLATLGLGAVAVPLNPTSPAAELEVELASVGARLLLAGPSAKEAVAELAPGTVDHLVLPESSLVEGARPFEELLKGPAVPVVDRDPGDLAVLIFTAGTSGSPKAAMLTHGNLLSNLEQAQRHPGRQVRPDDVILGVLPIFHIFGLNVVLGLTLKAGASVVLVERFDPASSLETIRDRGVTILVGAPPMYAAWAAMGQTGDMAKVRLATSGAAPLNPEVADAFTARHGVAIHEGYGLTEASPVVTAGLIGEPPRRGSIGVPLPGVEVRLVDEDGEDALLGDAGEIWVRGPNVFAGYWDDEEATAAAITPDGWLRTGDIATMGDDGHLYIVDRVKDLIIVSGFNVYPAEVEDALGEHPGIESVAVVGVAHPYSGEAVKAFVVVRPDHHLEEDEVISFCAERLARYKCPTKVTFVDSLPQGLAGKLLRRALR
jgi:long-chain acyl-CoA synthetase